VRYPELFVLGGQEPALARSGLEQCHARAMQERRISYQRSDGSPWEGRLAEVYRRRLALEVASNPNDCPAVRRGADPGMPAYATCQRRAPADQRSRMEQYRPWFHAIRRPPR